VPAYSLADPAVLAFIVIPVVLVALLAWGVAHAWSRAGRPPVSTRRAVLLTILGAAVWMGMTALAAQSGALRNWTANPPPFALLVVAVVVIAVSIAFSPVGWRVARFVPLWVLVAVQAFRLPLELAMHAMYARGIMPEQMTYTGRNFDIVTGITALPIAALVASGRGGRALVAAWNVLGLALLLNVVVVAILATPRFAYFGSERLNVWVTYVPFIWLPAVMVLAALAGHLVVFRALMRKKPAPLFGTPAIYRSN
jgi:hypothetical protein